MGYPNIIIDNVFSKLNINLVLGVIYAKVRVQKEVSQLWGEISKISEKVKEMTIQQIRDLPEINSLRKAYSSLGKKPTDFLGSNEALLSRLVKGKGLNSINNIVDINNIVSLETFRSVGSYDLDKLGREIYFRLGAKGEVYGGVSNRPLNLENLPILSDEDGPFGSPTADSKRAIISEETTNLMMIIISFDGEDNLEQQIKQITELLAHFANAQDIQTNIVRAATNTLVQDLLNKDKVYAEKKSEELEEISEIVNDKSTKASVKRKMNMAALDDNFRFTLLKQAI